MRHSKYDVLHITVNEKADSTTFTEIASIILYL